MSGIRFLSKKVRSAFQYRDTVRAIRNVFGMQSRTREQKLVLAWLGDVCHATETVGRINQPETERAIGRREVWLALQDVLRITEEDFRDLQEDVAGWGK